MFGVGRIVFQLDTEMIYSQLVSILFPNHTSKEVSLNSEQLQIQSIHAYILLFFMDGSIPAEQRITQIRIAANKPLNKFGHGIVVVFTEGLLVDQSQAPKEISHKSASYALLQH